MTLYTALVIQNKENDIRCELYAQHEKTGKFAGAINIYHDGFFHTTLISSNTIFDSAEAAVTAMEDVVKQVRDTDFSKKIEELPI